jgi:hypothetical protein
MKPALEILAGRGRWQTLAPLELPGIGAVAHDPAGADEQNARGDALAGMVAALIMHLRFEVANCDLRRSASTQVRTGGGWPTLAPLGPNHPIAKTGLDKPVS